MDVFGAHWENHFERIREDWLRRVGEEDVVLLPGDLTWAMRLEDAMEDIARVGELPGRKIILRGNHDYWWSAIGRVRRALVTEGAFANQNEFTHLTTIEQIDPIYVRFSQPASQYSSLRRAVVSGLWKGVPLGEIKVRLLLSNGEEYPHSGRIIFSDMAVDPNTDTIEMRALFPNPDQELLPGAYVRVVFDRAVRDNVFAIPRDAVIRTAQGASVFVVGPEGVLEARPVRADTLNGREWLVSEGLRDGDRVAVSHTMSLRPGMKVRSAAARPQPHAQQ